jgi:hypothetical protein
MIRVKFLVAGREEKFKDAQEEMACNRLRGQIQRKLALLACAEHSKPLEVAAIGESLSSLTLHVFACCTRMRLEAERALEPQMAQHS